jgi:hypothetical protein
MPIAPEHFIGVSLHEPIFIQLLGPFSRTVPFPARLPL